MLGHSPRHSDPSYSTQICVSDLALHLKLLVCYLKNESWLVKYIFEKDLTPAQPQLYMVNKIYWEIYRKNQ